MTKLFAVPSRRTFLKTSAAAAAVATLGEPFARAQAARWTRYNATSPQGQKALDSYQKAILIMLRLPPDHPHNWFRNAFVHLMDCPHGNWWFYVWHRGFVGYFEEVVRRYSGDASFAFPYWDWTALPEIPATMFRDGLTPRSPAFMPYNKDIATFTAYFKPTFVRYWNALTPSQRVQLNKRGYKTIDDTWNDVTGYDPATKKIIPGNISFADNARARYLTAGNPKLNKRCTFDASLPTLNFGLSAPDFVSTYGELSFNSSQKDSHNDAPGGTGKFFSTLEGLPHNQIHNYSGGLGPWDPGPYGNMTNNLSPFDPLFFLHHSNMDRLWDVWTRKQIKQGQPYLPIGAQWDAYRQEPFLFFVDAQGKYVLNGKAEDFVSTTRFSYNYQPGSGENVIHSAAQPLLKGTRTFSATVYANGATLSLPATALRAHLAQANTPRLAALITLPHPGAADTREFDVLVGAPAGATQAAPDSPYYAGTLSFFGHMSSMAGMEGDATFVVPLPHNEKLLSAPTPAANGNVQVSVQVVPVGKAAHAPVLKAVRVQLR